MGTGKRATFEEYLEPLSYDKAFTLSLKAAEEMADECSKINPFKFPTVVSLGTSKLREVITVHYKFDPEAGSACRKPPEGISLFAKRVFVPHFGAEFYMHVRFKKKQIMSMEYKLR